MPVYVYICQKGHREEALRKYEDRDREYTCQMCYESQGVEREMERVIAVPAPMPSSSDRPGRGRG